MTIDVMIIADVDGKRACAQFKIDSLDWIPLEKGYQVRPDEIPTYIWEINLGSEETAFRQAVIDSRVERTQFRDAMLRKLRGK